MAALDEVMVAATTGELHLLNLGHTYCGVLDACWEVFDLGRAREWTAAPTRWREGQPDLVPYRGPCLVHRVELMRLPDRGCTRPVWPAHRLQPSGPRRVNCLGS
jgi:hypothetical protein